MRKFFIAILFLILSVPLYPIVGRYQCCRVVSWRDLKDGEPISFGMQDGTNPTDSMAYMFRYRALASAGWSYDISLYPPCLDTLSNVVSLVDVKPRGLFTQPELGNCYFISLLDADAHQYKIKWGETSCSFAVDAQNNEGTRLKNGDAGWTFEETPDGYFFIYAGKKPYQTYLCYDNYYNWGNKYIGARGYGLSSFPINLAINQWQNGGHVLDELVDNVNYNYPAAWTVCHWAWCYPLRLCLSENGQWRWNGLRRDSISLQSSIKMPSDNEIECDRGHLVGWALHPHAEPEDILFAPYDYLALTDSVTLYAVYEIPRQTIYYHIGDHGHMPQTTQQTGWAFTVPTPIVDDGYSFVGWSTQPNAVDADFYPNDKYPDSNSTYLPDGDIHLYAVYEKAFDVIEWGQQYLTINYLGSADKLYLQLGEYVQTFALSAMSVDEGLYCIPLDATELQANYGETMYLNFLSSSGEILQVGNIKVPILIASNRYLSEFPSSILAKTSVVIVNGGHLTVDSTNVTIVHPVIVYGGGTFVVPSGSSVSCSSLLLQAGSISQSYLYLYPQLNLWGELSVTTSCIQYRYILNTTCFSSLTLPIATSIADIHYWDGAATQLNQSLWLDYYDGAARAIGKKDWNLIQDPNKVLLPGEGYTIFAASQRQIRAGGYSFYPKYAFIEIPLNISTPYTENLTKSVPIYSHPASKPNDSGWNLVGCPYFSTIRGELQGLNGHDGIGLLVFDDMTNTYSWEGTLRYVVIPNDYGTGYKQILSNRAVLPAFKNFFVQVGATDAAMLTFPLLQRESNVLARRMTHNTDCFWMAEISLSSSSGESDHLGVLVDNSFTKDYDMNADLSKWRNVGLNFYAVSDTDALAYVALNDTLAKEISLGYSVTIPGTYTINLVDIIDDDGSKVIYLRDLETNKIVNLLEQSYMFQATSGIYNRRFKLVILPQNQIPSSANNPFYLQNDVGKFFHNGHIYIRHGSTIYNVFGNSIIQ